MTDEEPSLNIPSLLTLAVVSYFVLRWFFHRDESSAGGSRGRGRGNVVDPAQVEQIAQMFPQLSTRDIMWDLQRNGGSVAATTERVLTGRGLETPPPSFQPQVSIPPTNIPPRQTATTASVPKADTQDLISRYNLTEKAKSPAAESQPDIPSKSSWSQNKEERQRILQKRRDDMILAARRKMMQKNQSVAQ
ncbi:AMFR protein, putative [Penicillium digitatum]|uniref:Coupling of ubiquitin conjugation to ER degradation protein 1 n=3 Tax=Penicillium digitatum TaxID=36651 RepID=K9GD29_PEND2|nr:AMFR protein, putative [Penicillium digitatum Pd1]EKV19092.1 AMFR protein, putative [Penicillium digitatum PHI26]EKV21001.1 AMFR protein, putative [Penicillium digitatum Pd1]KAG0153940.1 hypothetical protein PDIDSM_1319 [Penicillium digitatum]QQK48326.1 AMFR protein, putative [Penicillium digitatum]